MRTDTETAKFGWEVYQEAHKRLAERLDGDENLATALLAGSSASDLAKKVKLFLENRPVSLSPEKEDRVRYIFSEAKAMHTLLGHMLNEAKKRAPDFLTLEE